MDEMTSLLASLFSHLIILYDFFVLSSGKSSLAKRSCVSWVFVTVFNHYYKWLSMIVVGSK
jgi:hypothetical protein